jgi:fatty-acyl-CoA synthase
MASETLQQLLRERASSHTVLKRELAAQGPTAGDGELWIREPRGTRYEPA